jgi:S1-C subfamily serine protease
MIFATLALSIITISLVKTNTETVVVPYFADHERPVASMVFLRRTNSLEFLSCVPAPSLEPSPINPCELFSEPSFRDGIINAINEQFSFTITGSASVIGHDVGRDSSYVLTAYHVCDDFNQRYLALGVPIPVPHTLVMRYTPTVVMTDYFGNDYDADLIRGDEDNDLCLLESGSLMEHVAPIRVASEPPLPGDPIFNIASPHGISRPGAVLSYEGYHAGIIPGGSIIEDNHYLNAIPTAPGSSGSAILNSRGELISVVSYGFIRHRPGPAPPDMWPNASAGPSLEAIQELIRTRRIQ